MAPRYHSRICSFFAVVVAIATQVDTPVVWAQKASPPAAPRTGEEIEPETDKSGPPPSKMVERAKKLYDRGDYYSASIELDKVIKGNEDSAGNKQWAEFFMGKSLFHLRFYAASLVYFDNIVGKGPSHKYYRRTLQWPALSPYTK